MARERQNRDQAKRGADPAAGRPADPAKVARIKEMIRKGEYNTKEKIDAILDAFIKDFV